jgi:predicted outer membrane repeat protein
LHAEFRLILTELPYEYRISGSRELYLTISPIRCFIMARRRSSFSSSLFTSLRLQPLEDRSVPAIITVTTASDTGTFTDGLVSLREALQAANTDLSVDGSIAGNGADTIVFGDGSGTTGGTNFTDGLADTITLLNPLQVTTEVTITGGGANSLTLSGNNAASIFNINTPAASIVTISGMTVTQGIGNVINVSGLATTTFSQMTITANSTAGSVITNGGTQLTIDQSTISNNDSGNSLGVIANNSKLIITDSTFTGNTGTSRGGAIYSDTNKTLTISRSTFANNKAPDGGAIFSFGTTTITDSTFTNNSAVATGGAIVNENPATLVISQSTLVGNTAGDSGGAIFGGDNSTTRISQSTLIGNTANLGGGLFLISSTTNDIGNSLIVGNTGGEIGGMGTYTDNGGNLLAIPGGKVLGDILAVDAMGNPLLASNGGVTQTVAVVFGSDAINAGDNTLATIDGKAGSTALTTDQRGTGFNRIGSGTVDAGAVEYTETPSLIVTTNLDVSDSSDDLTSLREAIAYAATQPGADTITFGNGTGITGGTNFTDGVADTITLNGTSLQITSDVTITGGGASLLTISGNNAASGIFFILPAAGPITVAISGMTLTNANQAVSTFGNSTTILSQMTITANSKNSAITSTAAQLTIDQSTISNNTGSIGAAVALYSGAKLTITNSTLSGNTAGGNGGAIYSNLGILTISGSTISGNKGLYGGAISSNNSTTITNSTISGNIATAGGGGIFVTSGKLEINQSTLFGNVATSKGGGIFSNSTTISIRQSTVTGNSAPTGGGLHLEPGSTNDIGNSLIAGNTGGELGGTGSFTNNGGNLLAIPTGKVLGDIVAVNGSGVPILADNGGPTQTVALVTGSVAVNAGSNALIPPGTTTDQRGTGFNRLLAGTVDIGAIESPFLPPVPPEPPVTPPVVPTPTPTPTPTPAPEPTPTPTNLSVTTALDPITGNILTIKNDDGSTRFKIAPFVGYQQAISLATGDVNGDGFADVIVGAAGRGGPHVKIVDGKTGVELYSFFAFDPAFEGGVSVAAGDVNGDGFIDIVTSAGPGAAPHVKVFSGKDLSELYSFFAYALNFSGGVVVAAADINRDGFADIVTTPIKGVSHVQVFNGKNLNVIASYFGFTPEIAASAIAAGDTNGDGFAEVFVSAGPAVRKLDGRTGTELASLTPYGPTFLGGIDLSGTKDSNGLFDLITVADAGAFEHHQVFDGDQLTPLQSFFVVK